MVVDEVGLDSGEFDRNEVGLDSGELDRTKSTTSFSLHGISMMHIGVLLLGDTLLGLA